MVIGSLLNLAATDAKQTRTSLDYQRAVLVAESGVDYGVMRLRDVILQYRLSTLVSNSDLQAVLNAIPDPTPPPGDYVYQTPSGQSAFKITVDSPIVTGTITNGLQQLGVYGTFQLFTITCGALNLASGVGAVVQDRTQALSVYVMRYGVFYQVLTRMEPEAFATSLNDWLLRQAGTLPQALALDGKMIRDHIGLLTLAQHEDGAPQAVAIYDQKEGTPRCEQTAAAALLLLPLASV